MLKADQTLSIAPRSMYNVINFYPHFVQMEARRSVWKVMRLRLQYSLESAEWAHMQWLIAYVSSVCLPTGGCDGEDEFWASGSAEVWRWSPDLRWLFHLINLTIFIVSTPSSCWCAHHKDTCVTVKTASHKGFHKMSELKMKSGQGVRI